MKKILLFCITFICSLNTFAQTEPAFEKKLNHELGINFTSIIEHLFVDYGDFGFNFLDLNYEVNYKYNLKHFAIRSRFGGYYRYHKKEGEDYHYSQSGRKSIYKTINIAIGLERTKYLSKKWSFNYGAEFLYQYDYELSTSGSSSGGEYPERVRLTKDIGWDVLLGFKYYFTPWLFLGSESSIVLLNRKNSTTYYYLIPDDSRDKSNKEKFINYFPTNGIILGIRF